MHGNGKGIFYLRYSQIMPESTKDNHENPQSGQQDIFRAYLHIRSQISTSNGSAVTVVKPKSKYEYNPAAIS